MFDLSQLLTFICGALVAGCAFGYFVGRSCSEYEQKYKEELFG